MVHRHTYRTLHRSELFALGDYRCREDDRRFGAVERAEAPVLAFVRRGTFERRVNGRDALLGPPQAFFSNAGDEYRVRHPLAGGDECTVLQPSAELLAELAPARDPAAPFARLDAPCGDRAFALQRALLSLASTGETVDRLALEEAALALCAAVLRAAEPEAPTPEPGATAARHRELARDAQELLSARYTEPLGVAGLAAELGSSPFHLCRVFRRETGATLHAWRTRLRLRAALERVAGGAPDLTGLALELGFASHAHLTTAFTRAFGLPPSALRRLGVKQLERLSKDLEA